MVVVGGLSETEEVQDNGAQNSVETAAVFLVMHLYSRGADESWRKIE